MNDLRSRKELRKALAGMSRAYLTLLVQCQQERKMWNDGVKSPYKNDERYLATMEETRQSLSRSIARGD